MLKMIDNQLHEFSLAHTKVHLCVDVCCYYKRYFYLLIPSRDCTIKVKADWQVSRNL